MLLKLFWQLWSASCSRRSGRRVDGKKQQPKSRGGSAQDVARSCNGMWQRRMTRNAAETEIICIGCLALPLSLSTILSSTLFLPLFCCCCRWKVNFLLCVKNVEYLEETRRKVVRGERTLRRAACEGGLGRERVRNYCNRHIANYATKTWGWSKAATCDIRCSKTNSGTGCTGWAKR